MTIALDVAAPVRTSRRCSCAQIMNEFIGRLTCGDDGPRGDLDDDRPGDAGSSSRAGSELMAPAWDYAQRVWATCTAAVTVLHTAAATKRQPSTSVAVDRSSACRLLDAELVDPDVGVFAVDLQHLGRRAQRRSAQPLLRSARRQRG